MAWLQEQGIISNHHDYADLPAIELEKARLWREADLAHQKKQAAAAYRKKQHDAQAKGVSRGKRR